MRFSGMSASGRWGLGAKRNGTPACAHGFAGCLSFYPTKNLGGFGDGGAICTNDDAFAEKCRQRMWC